MARSRSNRSRSARPAARGAARPSAAAGSTPPEVARHMARALSTLATDLSNPYSESTDDFTPFSGRLDPAAPNEEAALRAALGVSDRYRLDTRELDPNAFDEWGEPYASTYAMLYRMMDATLTDLQVVKARRDGIVRVRCWFVGRMGAEWVVGLRTMSTET